ncbi:MAG: hypothetical protein J6X55_16095 [Victivallales bacterium]|nr:hypothetical protein [Victivallales bacterium]
MQYRFFICKPSNEWSAARVLRQYCLHKFSYVENQDTLLPFNVKRLCQLLRKASGEAAGKQPMFKFRQVDWVWGVDPLQLVSVVTEYSLAQKVCDALSKCLAKDGLVLFDAEMGFLDAISEICQRERQEVVTLRLAHLRYCNLLRQKLNSADKPVHVSIYKLGDCVRVYDDAIRSPVVDTSIAVMRGELPCVAKQLYAILSESAEGHGKSVYCKDRCFVVKNKTEGYRLRFVLEGTGRSPMHLCWIENGEVKLELLHRMGMYRTRNSIKKLEGWSHACEEEDYIRSRLYFGEAFFTRGDLKNPADRFVDSYKISYRLKKYNMGLVYGRHPSKSPSEFCFCETEDDEDIYDSWKTESGFIITEEEAAPLLALIEEVIPYYYNYYYDSFHVRREEVEQILVRLKEVRAIVSRNPLDESLGKIAERLFTYSFAWPCLPCEDGKEDWTERKKNVLYSHRRELVALFDFFEWWLEGLRERPHCMFYGFHIIGP